MTMRKCILVCDIVLEARHTCLLEGQCGTDIVNVLLLAQLLKENMFLI